MHDIEQLLARVDELTCEVVALRIELAAAQAENAHLRTENADLRARLGLNSTNSNRPPSTDSPFKRPPPQPPTGRRPGGQPGHKGHRREGVEPTRVVAVEPEDCAHCGLDLPADAERGEPQRHVVVEIRIDPEATEYTMGCLMCPKCRHWTKAQRPAGVPAGNFGPRVDATIGLLTMHGVSRGLASSLMKALFGVQMSVGSVQNACERVDASVADAVDEVARQVLDAAVAHADETGWRVRGKLGWIWAALSSEAELFRYDPRRNTDALCKILGCFDGVLHSDRWGPYNIFRTEMRQLCHGHLRRDIQAVIDRGGVDADLGRRWLEQSDQMFHVWHEFERGELDANGLAAQMAPAAWKTIANEALGADGSKTRAFAGNLLKLWPALWSFIEYEGVVPTNNEQEQAIRKVVRLRKTSYGSTSAHGAEMTAHLMTVLGTARRQGLDLLDWLVRRREVALAGIAGPALLASG